MDDSKWMRLVTERPLSEMERIFLDRLMDDLMKRAENDPQLKADLQRLAHYGVQPDGE